MGRSLRGVRGTELMSFGTIRAREKNSFIPEGAPEEAPTYVKGSIVGYRICCRVRPTLTTVGELQVEAHFRCYSTPLSLL